MSTLVGELTWVGDEARSIPDVDEEVIHEVLEFLILVREVLES
jgi:hypothetical protein